MKRKLFNKAGAAATLALMVVSAGLALAGCDPEGDDDKPNSNIPGGSGGDTTTLVGRWNSSRGQIAFTATGWTLSTSGGTLSGAYTYSGTRLTLTINGQEVSGTAALSNGTLTLSEFSGQVASVNGEYTKVTAVTVDSLEPLPQLLLVCLSTRRTNPMSLSCRRRSPSTPRIPTQTAYGQP